MYWGKEVLEGFERSGSGDHLVWLMTVLAPVTVTMTRLGSDTAGTFTIQASEYLYLRTCTYTSGACRREIDRFDCAGIKRCGERLCDLLGFACVAIHVAVAN